MIRDCRLRSVTRTVVHRYQITDSHHPRKNSNRVVQDRVVLQIRQILSIVPDHLIGVRSVNPTGEIMLRLLGDQRRDKIIP